MYLLALLVICTGAVRDEGLDGPSELLELSPQHAAEEEEVREEMMRLLAEHSLRHTVERADAREVARHHRQAEHAVDPHNASTEESSKTTGSEASTEESSKTTGNEAFHKAEEDSHKVQEDVAAVKEATDHAEERGKAVDKDFNKYDERLKKLEATLDKLAQKSFRWQEEVMKSLAEAESDKYSPLATAQLAHSRQKKPKGEGTTTGAPGTTQTTAHE
mmetsp:Transcript_759/g.1681  ORF Transcript_759/g.1681 Transcript_759/m.1681 type:complete len:218 (+) Transcript_759:106-759(+)